MVNKSFISVLAVVAFVLGPTIVLAQEATVKKGSLEATGTGTPATVAQAAEESEGEFELAWGWLLFPVGGGGIAAGLLLGEGDGDSGPLGTSPTNTN